MKKLLPLLLILSLVGCASEKSTSKEYASEKPTAKEHSLRIISQEVHWPNGELKGRREVIEDETKGFIEHGKATTWYESGKIKWQGEYRHGRQIGKWTDWYEGGQKEGEGECREDGTGFEVHWYLNGTKKSEGHGKYIAQDGKFAKHGKWSTWDQDGRKLSDMGFRNNQQHGTITLWHPNGKVKVEAQFKEGKPHGTASAWDLEGNLISEEYYVDGVLSKEE